MDGGAGEESLEFKYKDLLDRFQSLETSHVKLQEQLKFLLQEKIASTSSNNSSNNGSSKNYEGRGMRSDSEGMTSYPGWGHIPGAYFAGSPYRNVFECMGHALHVTRVGSGDIIFWNRAAERLYGYKEHQVLGYRDIELLLNEEYHASALRMMDTLSNGMSWSGQLPMKKRSGKMFMALVTKSPLYEDGELVGIITNSHEGTVFNSTYLYLTRMHQDHVNRPGGGCRINLERIQWRPWAQIAALPHLASSVSNLASKVLSRKHGEAEVENQDAKADKPPRTPKTKPFLGLFMENGRTHSVSSKRGGYNI